jgi:hypothetical protein
MASREESGAKFRFGLGARGEEDKSIGELSKLDGETCIEVIDNGSTESTSAESN